VLWISAEDDPNVVTVNRLRAAGADMSRVYDLSTASGCLPRSAPCPSWPRTSGASACG
jgi:hypothetical protein